jgi:hypothetical protein
MPVNQFVEIYRNTPESFLYQGPWTALLGPCAETGIRP